MGVNHSKLLLLFFFCLLLCYLRPVKEPKQHLTVSRNRNAFHRCQPKMWSNSVSELSLDLIKKFCYNFSGNP